MASEVAVSNLYLEISRFGQNDDYERALKSANKILHQLPEEFKAFHCKIVCLIHLSRFQDALNALSKQPKFASELVFEKAYCLYRLNAAQEGLVALDAAASATANMKELKAQILYRLERYEDCFDVYRDIIKNSTDSYEVERETNLSAVCANMAIERSEREVAPLREHTYELAYNAACKLAGQGLYAEAERKLKVAERLCRETLEEDATPEEDVEQELAIIKVQLGYCQQMQGREKEAQCVYGAILKRKPDDAGLVAIASNNSVSLNRDQNVFDSKKKMRSATTDGLQHKLNSRQRKEIAINQCLLAMYTNQGGDACSQLCERLVQSYPETRAQATLIRAILLAREGQAIQAATLLQQSDTANQLPIKLAAVQLLLSQGEIVPACKILEDLLKSGCKPGLVSALVMLHVANNDRDAASRVLQLAVETSRKDKVSCQNLSSLWREAADFHLRCGKPALAAKSLEELLKLNPNDKKTLAQIVLAYSEFDRKEAQRLSKQLPSLCDMTTSIDVDALENSSWMMGSKVIKKSAAKVEPSPGTPGNELGQKKKRNRKRKGKLPKNFDVSCDPDPERWLPRHERTTFRRKKDRRNKEIGKGTQGAATGASDQFDMSKMPSQQAKASPNPQSSPVPEGPRQTQRKVQQKKKKKNNKW